MNGLTGQKRLREQIRQMERLLGVLNENDMTCCGVTMAQCHAIVEIGRAGALSLSDLAELLRLDNSTTSRTVNNLVTRGLAGRLTDTADRRFLSISLTETGTAIFKDIENRMDTRFATIYGALPDDRQDQILEDLQILLEVLSKSDCC